jgi:hypothetical protein
MGLRFAKPKHDMAICFVVFNPVQTKRIIMNYLYVRTLFEKQGLPFYTIELLYEGRGPEIPDAIHVKANSFLFHKENLYRILETKIPNRYTKLAFLDADVYFQDKSWYSKTSELLNTYDVVQPFERAHWLDLTYKKTMLTRKTIVLDKKVLWDFAYHPGFAWCMTRKWYKQVGFFDYAISGSGDTLSTAAWLNKKFPEKFQSLPKPLLTPYVAFCLKPKPRITYLNGTDLYHLYHGSRENRQYAERHKMLDIKGDIEDYITQNKEGVLEWKQPEKWNPVYLHYFKKRDDDSLSPDKVELETKKNTSKLNS